MKLLRKYKNAFIALAYTLNQFGNKKRHYFNHL